MPLKNNVTRMLEAKGILFQAHELPERKVCAVEAAEFFHVDSTIVFKTIVTVPASGGKAILALVPGPCEVDAKALAKALGEKKIKVTTQREAEALTGLQAGGISPLALLDKGLRVVIDASALQHEIIYISGGQWGLNLSLSPKDLIAVTNAGVAEIAQAVA
jgi:Cys-tRNA(Pro)/Cys-tRNA(Cys) deacylase